MLGSPILCPKGMRLMMFQLSGFYCMFLGFLSSRFRDLGSSGFADMLQLYRALILDLRV